MVAENNGTRFEFLLTLNGNIIIQRFFYVNNYNSKAKNSLELYYCVSNIASEIEEDLKQKSFNYTYENQNYFQNLEDVEIPDENTNEYFLLEIKLNNDIFIQRIFPAYVFHPKARYSVDIRPKVRSILSYLTSVLSMGEYETTYLDNNLIIK